eukprot:g24129.t1
MGTTAGPSAVCAMALLLASLTRGHMCGADNGPVLSLTFEGRFPEVGPYHANLENAFNNLVKDEDNTVFLPQSGSRSHVRLEPAFSVSSDFSVLLWLETGRTDQTFSRHTLHGLLGPERPQQERLMYAISTVQPAQVYLGTDLADNNVLVKLSDLSPGWHQVALVRSGQAVQWFVDAQPLYGGEQASWRFPQHDIAVVGNVNLKEAAGAGLAIDDVQFYQCALSAAAVEAAYQSAPRARKQLQAKAAQAGPAQHSRLETVRRRQLMNGEGEACQEGATYRREQGASCQSCSSCIMQPLQVAACTLTADTICLPDPCTELDRCVGEKGSTGVCLRRSTFPFYSCENLQHATHHIELSTRVAVQVPLRVSEQSTEHPLPHTLASWQKDVETCLQASLSFYYFSTATTSGSASKRMRTKQESTQALLQRARVLVTGAEEFTRAGVTDASLTLEVQNIPGKEGLAPPDLRKKFESSLQLAAILNAAVNHGSASSVSSARCAIFAGAKVMTVEDVLLHRCENGEVALYPETCGPAQSPSSLQDHTSAYSSVKDAGGSSSVHNSQHKATSLQQDQLIAVGIIAGFGLCCGLALCLLVRELKQCVRGNGKEQDAQGKEDARTPGLPDSEGAPWSTGDRRKPQARRNSPIKSESRSWSSKLQSKFRGKFRGKTAAPGKDSPLVREIGKVTPLAALTSALDQAAPSPAESDYSPEQRDHGHHDPDQTPPAQLLLKGAPSTAGDLPLPVRCGRPREGSSSPALIARTPTADPAGPHVPAPAGHANKKKLQQQQQPLPQHKALVGPSDFSPEEAAGKSRKGKKATPGSSSRASGGKKDNTGKGSGGKGSAGECMTRSWKRVNLGKEGGGPRPAQAMAGMLPPETPPTPVPLENTPRDLGDDTHTSPDTQPKSMAVSDNEQSTPTQAGATEDELIRRLHFSPENEAGNNRPSPLVRELGEVPLLPSLGSEDCSDDSDELQKTKQAPAKPSKGKSGKSKKGSGRSK